MGSSILPYSRRLAGALRKAALVGIDAGIVALHVTPAPAAPCLMPEDVARIFCTHDSEAGRAFLPIAVAVVEGSFTAPGTAEAVVSFTDANQPPASAVAEIWLLRLAGEKWEPVVRIAESDTAEFTTTDVIGAGALVMITHTTV